MTEANSAPLISIITIVYNDENSVENTIISVLSKKTDDIEYIIIDGASTDRTPDIINKYASQIDLIISEKDGGISDAFNKGIANANGSWLLFLNSGDLFAESISIDSVKKRLKQNPNHLVCFYKVMLSNAAHTMPTEALIKKGKDFIVALAEIPHQGAFIQKDCFKKYGGFSPFFRLRMDYEFFARLSRFPEKIVFVDEVLAIYLVGGRSGQLSNFETFLWEGVLVKNRYKIKVTLKEVLRFTYYSLRNYLRS